MAILLLMSPVAGSTNFWTMRLRTDVYGGDKYEAYQ